MILNKRDKIQEAQVQLDNRDHYRPLEKPMVTDTSYLKDTTDLINFIEKTQVSNDTILVSIDVTSLYTNISQEEGITIVC